MKEKILSLLRENQYVGVCLDDVVLDGEDYDFGGWLAHAFLLFREGEKTFLLQSYIHEYPCRIDEIDIDAFLDALGVFLIDPVSAICRDDSLWEKYFDVSPCYIGKIEHYLLRIRYL